MPKVFEGLVEGCNAQCDECRKQDQCSCYECGHFEECLVLRESIDAKTTDVERLLGMMGLSK